MLAMSDFVSLTCPSCGGKLEITEDIERFACAYCGIDHMVKRGGGIVTLLAVDDNIEQIRIASDRTASELAFQRLSAEVASLENKITECKQSLLSDKDSFRAFSVFREHDKAFRKKYRIPLPPNRYLEVMTQDELNRFADCLSNRRRYSRISRVVTDLARSSEEYRIKLPKFNELKETIDNI